MLMMHCDIPTSPQNHYRHGHLTFLATTIPTNLIGDEFGITRLLPLRQRLLEVPSAWVPKANGRHRMAADQVMITGVNLDATSTIEKECHRDGTMGERLILVLRPPMTLVDPRMLVDRHPLTLIDVLDGVDSLRTVYHHVLSMMGYLPAHLTIVIMFNLTQTTVSHVAAQMDLPVCEMAAQLSTNTFHNTHPLEHTTGKLTENEIAETIVSATTHLAQVLEVDRIRMTTTGHRLVGTMTETEIEDLIESIEGRLATMTVIVETAETV